MRSLPGLLSTIFYLLTQLVRPATILCLLWNTDITGPPKPSGPLNSSTDLGMS